MSHKNQILKLIIILTTLICFAGIAFAPGESFCYQGDETNQTYCESLPSDESCYWDTENCFNEIGCCFEEGFWSDYDDGLLSGSTGCWSNDGDKDACTQNNNCHWAENGMNQNSWCHLTNIFEVKDLNPLADVQDIGCCEPKGCWSFDNNETLCDEAFGGGVCNYVSDGFNHCDPMPCNEINSTHANTVNSALSTSLTAQTICGNMSKVNAPCIWEESSCNFPGGGGDGFDYFTGIDACIQSNGWWNGTTCIAPGGETFDGGSAGLFSGGSQTCWMFDNQPLICGNVTGCTFCEQDGGPSGIFNVSSDNACNNKQTGFCEGHAIQDINSGFTNVDNSRGIVASDIKLRQVCNCGPLENARWNSSSSSEGNFCMAGAKTDAQKKSCQPPMGVSGTSVSFCEHQDALNNLSLCEELASVYMMPCQWGSADDFMTGAVPNCQFNKEAAFGDLGMGDFEELGTEPMCLASGGVWQTENYVDVDMVFKQDSWCEKGAMFDLASGASLANKGNCDTDCWACESPDNAAPFPNLAAAEAACINSALGYCEFEEDVNAFNGFGYCDVPPAFSKGKTANCYEDCGSCEFSANPELSCTQSLNNCKWVNNTENLAGGYCISKTKKTCETDCFNCYNSADCLSSSDTCEWQENLFMCTPAGIGNQEICFDGADNDGDSAVDCADTDCSFDTFCGGDTFAQCHSMLNFTSCNATTAWVEGVENIQCEWVQFPWDSEAHCEMPGSTCWQFDDNPTACDAEPKCTNRTLSPGFCGMNHTFIETAAAGSSCFSLNYSSCLINTNCGYVNETPTSGFCDFNMFSSCGVISEQEECGSGLSTGKCAWIFDVSSPNGGWCDPICFSLENGDCNSHVAPGVTGSPCSLQTSMCEPSFFAEKGFFNAAPEGAPAYVAGKTGCAASNGNSTDCFNSFGCEWKPEQNALNSKTGNGADNGFCNEQGAAIFVQSMTSTSRIVAVDGGEEVGLTPYADAIGIKIKDLPDAYMLSLDIPNLGMNYSAACNDYPINIGNLSQLGQGQNESKYFFYLDTNGEPTGNCCANHVTNLGFQEDCGYEFLISYNPKVVSGVVQDEKTFYKCNAGEWAPTNVFLSLTKHLSFGPPEQIDAEGCSKGTPMIGIEKDTLESFTTLYDVTQSMRIMATTADGITNRLSPIDFIGPGFYTSGSDGFSFVDCSDTSTVDTLCKNMKKFGFNIYEDCHVVGDEDNDELADCLDSDCAHLPHCGGNGAPQFDQFDKQPPIPTFTNIDTMHNAAYIRVDTNEPSMGKVYFFNQTMECFGAPTEIITDVGSQESILDDFKSFQRIPLDNGSLGFELKNGTEYYYKTEVCDPSQNCANSNCLSFTTKAAAEYKEFIFKLDLPDGYTVDIPALGISDFNFTTVLDGNSYEVGIKTNTSVSRGINMTFNCGDLDLTFVGVDLTKPKSIDLTNAFICDQVNNILGMNSTGKSWDKLKHELGFGGYSDNIIIDFPVSFDPENNDVAWCADDGETNCYDMCSLLDCQEGDTDEETRAIISTSFGFSTYQISTSSSVAATSSSTGNGGGSGAGGSYASTEDAPEEESADMTDESTDGTESQGDELTTTGEETKTPWTTYILIGVLAVVLLALIVAFSLRRK